jgi:hypothetical protein
LCVLLVSGLTPLYGFPILKEHTIPFVTYLVLLEELLFLEVDAPAAGLRLGDFLADTFLFLEGAATEPPPT